MWAFKMQTQVALSTMEAEYIALSQSMRDLIPIREILKELMTIVFYHCRSPIILTRKLLTIRWAPVIMLHFVILWQNYAN